ncbi:MAG: hypothetical protein ACK4Q5_06025 [Saprospiraceae bacterium]
MATKTNRESIHFEVKINGEQASNNIKSLSKDLDNLRDEFYNLEDAGQQNTRRYQELKQLIPGVIKSINERYQAEKAAAERLADLQVNQGKTLKKLENEYRHLMAAIKNLNPESEEFAQKVQLMNSKKAAIDEIKTAFRQVKNEAMAAKEEVGETVVTIDELANNGGKALKQLEKDYGELLEIVSALPPEHGSFNDLVEKLRSKKAAIEEIKTAFKEVKEEIVEVKQEIIIPTNSLRALQTEAKQLREQIDLLDPATDEFKRALAELKAKEAVIDEIRAAFKEVKEEIKEVAAETNTLGNTALDLGDLVTGGLLTGGITAVAGAALAGAQAIAEEVAQVRKLKGEVQQLTGATGPELDAQTAKIQALANTFEQEQGELLQSANALSKQMGISTTEALTLIENGFLSGANANGEFLDQLKEYPAQFAQAGASADEFVAIISQNAKEGVFSDKGVDVIKEFGLRIREQTQSTRDAMTAAFGPEFSTKIFKGISDGSLTVVDAMKLVSTEMGNTAIPAEKLQTVVADVFGGAGEDAGLKYLQSLKDIKGSTAELIDTTNPYVQQQLQLQAANEDLAEAQVALSDTLSDVAGGFNTLKTRGEEFLYRFLTATIASWNFLYDGFVAFVNFVPGLGKAWDFLKAAGSGFLDILYNYPAILEGVKAGAKQMVDNVGDFFEELKIKAKIVGLELKKLLPFSDDAEIDRQIAELQNTKTKLAAEYRSIGEAFSAAYNEGLAVGEAKRGSAGGKSEGGNRPPQASGGLGGKSGGGTKDGKTGSAFDLTDEQRAEKELGGKGAATDPQQARLDRLAQTLGQELKLEQDKNQYVLEENQKHLANLKALEEQQKQFTEERVKKQIELENAKFDAAKSVTSGVIDLLSTDAKARKQNAGVIKASAKAGIAIDLAKEIQGIWKNANSNPINAIIPGFGQAFAAVQTAFAVGRAAKSAKQVDAQQYALGGIAPGPRHAQGGVKMVDGRSGQIVGEMEGGEPYMILSRNTYANNKGIVDALLYSSTRLGGRRIFADGGMFSTAPRLPAGVSGTDGGRTEALIGALLAEQQRTRSAIEAMPVVLKAEVKFQDIEEAGNTLSEIKAASAL